MKDLQTYWTKAEWQRESKRTGQRHSSHTADRQFMLMAAILGRMWTWVLQCLPLFPSTTPPSEWQLTLIPPSGVVPRGPNLHRSVHSDLLTGMQPFIRWAGHTQTLQGWTSAMCGRFHASQQPFFLLLTATCNICCIFWLHFVLLALSLFVFFLEVQFQAFSRAFRCITWSSSADEVCSVVMEINLFTHELGSAAFFTWSASAYGVSDPRSIIL